MRGTDISFTHLNNSVMCSTYDISLIPIIFIFNGLVIFSHSACDVFTQVRKNCVYIRRSDRLTLLATKLVNVVRIDDAGQVIGIDDFELAEEMSFNILRVGGTLTGQYDGLDEGSLVGNFSGQDLFITYAGGDGNDVTLFTVPEPTTVLIWSMLAGLGLAVRRRQ